MNYIYTILLAVMVAMSAVAHRLKPAAEEDDRVPLAWVTDPNPQREPQIEYLMAAAAMCIFPLIIVFVIFQRFLVKGIQLGALQG